MLVLQLERATAHTDYPDARGLTPLLSVKLGHANGKIGKEPVVVAAAVRVMPVDAAGGWSTASLAGAGAPDVRRRSGDERAEDGLRPQRRRESNRARSELVWRRSV